MLDDLAGKRIGERIQTPARVPRSVPADAGWAGWHVRIVAKGIERGTRLPPRLPLLVKLAEVLVVGDVAVLAGIDMDLGEGADGTRLSAPPCFSGVLLLALTQQCQSGKSS
jgi:hypothetical protein